MNILFVAATENWELYVYLCNSGANNNTSMGKMLNDVKIHSLFCYYIMYYC